MKDNISAASHIIQLSSLKGHVPTDRKLPYIVEADDADHERDRRPSQQGRVPLLHAADSPIHQPCLSKLLREELFHINALHLCRSPAQGGRVHTPSPQPFTNEEHRCLSPLPKIVNDPGPTHVPPKLLMPTLPCVSPLNLSPR